ncbi:MAG: hypothetical protein IPO27_01025 [Bacteroidetes bacterium]|nr:hypothetical protein [Bacteroidota bacterium]
MILNFETKVGKYLRVFVMLGALTFIGFGLTGCEKTQGNATIVRDCTGTYLTFKGDDYLVCNYEKLDGFASGSLVTATYKLIDECSNNQVVCLMYHEHKGIIHVSRVN